jgi:endonuclease I
MDPVDAEEIARHEVIAKYQKVRNPFVDFPQLVEKVADF